MDPPKKLAIITIITRKISIDIWFAQKKRGKLLAAANNGKLQKKSVGESQKQQKTIADPQFCSPGKFPTWHPWTAVSHRCGAWPPPERFLGKKTVGKSSVTETRR